MGPAGLDGSEEWARANAGRLPGKDVRDRAILFQFEAHNDAVRAFAATARLKAPLAAGAPAAGAWGENVFCGGASAATLCIGDARGGVCLGARRGRLSPRGGVFLDARREAASTSSNF